MNYIIMYIAFLFGIFSCSPESTNKISLMESYDFQNPIKIKITNKLKEISGLAKTADENLLAISDELGVIYKLNAENGKIIKRFFLGKWTAEADFEGIAISKDFIFAISSNGTLYKFKEGKNEESVDYEVIKLPFSSKFDIEGLYYDPELNGLLITPKAYSGKKLKNSRAVYFYSLEHNEIDKKPIFTISLKTLEKNFGITDFYPSGISKHPTTGNFFILSARGQNVIVEVNKLGEVISAQSLNEKKHRQPEGISFLNDNTLLISDEAAGKKPTITKYKYID